MTILPYSPWGKAAAHVSRTYSGRKGIVQKKLIHQRVLYIIWFAGVRVKLPVVLLHGLGSAGAHYGPLLRHLRKHVQKMTIVDFPVTALVDTKTFR